MQCDHEPDNTRSAPRLHALLERGDNFPSIEVTQPASLTDDERETLAAYERVPSKFDGLTKVTSPEAKARLAKAIELIRDYKSARTTRQARNRKRVERAKPKISRPGENRARLKALVQAIARKSGDQKFLEQLKGREQDLVNFRFAMDVAAARHGPKVSAQQLADTYVPFCDDRFTRDQARRWRDTVAKLEGAGGAWSNL